MVLVSQAMTGLRSDKCQVVCVTHHAEFEAFCDATIEVHNSANVFFKEVMKCRTRVTQVVAQACPPMNMPHDARYCKTCSVSADRQRRWRHILQAGHRRQQ